MLGRKICGWSFVDLSQLVKSEGEADVPHFSETGGASRGGPEVTRFEGWLGTNALSWPTASCRHCARSMDDLRILER
jgi:hypothetical protein